MERRSPTGYMSKQRREEFRLGRPITEEEIQEAAKLGWSEWRRVSPKLSTLRLRLYLKAKQEPKFRFYALYDRIYRHDVLRAAWEQVRLNKGAPGVDGVTIDQIVDAEDGPEGLVNELHESLRSKTYRPQPVKRVYIPKSDGRERPLGIPAIRDRVVQTAAVLILEPIFEADFLSCSYGFRPRRSAHDALAEIRASIQSGRKDVYDADLREYFDSIPHDKLMSAVTMRVADRSVMKLIRQWLRVSIEDERESGPPKRTSQGTPQGGVISPLLANIFMHWFDKFFHEAQGPARWAKARLVRYADDFVVLAYCQTERLRRWIEQTLEERMGLEVNREKTRIVDLKNEGCSLDFLGYTYRYCRDLCGRNSKYLNVTPSKKAVLKEQEVLRGMTARRLGLIPVPALIAGINRHLLGWASYFSFGYPRMAKRQINNFIRERLMRHLKRRSQRPYCPPEGVSYHKHLSELGLVYL